MISASVCPSSQPDTAVQPAKERHSYTTYWDTILSNPLRHPVVTDCRHHYRNIVIGVSEKGFAFWAGPCWSEHGTPGIVRAMEQNRQQQTMIVNQLADGTPFGAGVPQKSPGSRYFLSEPQRRKGSRDEADLHSSSRVSARRNKRPTVPGCDSACKKDPLGGVIGVQKGPLLDWGSRWLSERIGSLQGDAGGGDDREGSAGVFC